MVSRRIGRGAQASMSPAMSLQQMVGAPIWCESRSPQLLRSRWQLHRRQGPDSRRREGRDDLAQSAKPVFGTYVGGPLDEPVAADDPPKGRNPHQSPSPEGHPESCRTKTCFQMLLRKIHAGQILLVSVLVQAKLNPQAKVLLNLS